MQRSTGSLRTKSAQAAKLLIAATAGAAILVLAQGCSVNPTVRYVVADSANDVQAAQGKLIDSFYLQKNRLLIEYKDTAAAGKPASYEFKVTDTPVEETSAGHRVMMLRADSPWQRTTVNLTKVENTDLVASAGVDVEDRRSEFLQSAATVVKAVAPLVLGAAGGQKVCATFPRAPCEFVITDEFRNQLAAGAPFAGVPLNDDQTLTLKWGPVPITSRPVSDLPALGRRATSGIYYSACREATISYTAAAPGQAVPQQTIWHGKFADPQFVEFVSFPRKGSVKMHSQCGVSTTSDKDATQPIDTVISNAVTQAIAMKDAIDKAQQNGAKK